MKQLKGFCVALLKLFYFQILTIRLNYKLRWPESRMAVNESADWGQGEINISPDNIDVSRCGET